MRRARRLALVVPLGLIPPSDAFVDYSFGTLDSRLGAGEVYPSGLSPGFEMTPWLHDDLDAELCLKLLMSGAVIAEDQFAHCFNGDVESFSDMCGGVVDVRLGAHDVHSGARDGHGCRCVNVEVEGGLVAAWLHGLVVPHATREVRDVNVAPILTSFMLTKQPKGVLWAGIGIAVGIGPKADIAT